MKRLFFFIIFFFLGLILEAQNNPVDELFNKYSGNAGFTFITISSKMFSMFDNQDSKDEDINNVISRLKSIQILTAEDTLLNKNLDFYDELSKKTDFSGYEELMVVKEKNGITKFLIRESGKIIVELLIISGGQHGNTLISIRGDLDLKNISSLSKKMGIQQLENLENIEKKSP